MACENCITDWISCGVDSITVETGLQGAEGDVNWFIDNKGATYAGTSIKSSEGVFSIDATELPENLLNPYAGIFVLRLGDECNPDLFCDEFTCIQFEVRNGNAEKNTLSCCAATQP